MNATSLVPTVLPALAALQLLIALHPAVDTPTTLRPLLRRGLPPGALAVEGGELVAAPEARL